MQPTESLDSFYRLHFNRLPDDTQTDIGQVNVFRLEDYLSDTTKPVQYSRRDFYKISLIRGRNIYHYADKSIEIQEPTLLFFNPQVPYTWQPVAGDTTGFFCIFRETFFNGRFSSNLTDLPIFRPNGQSVYTLEASQDEEISRIYDKMLLEMTSSYSLKYDLLRNYVSELIHYALKLQPSDLRYQHPDARARLTAIFIELLERQFPIESPTQRFTIRSASDFASQLAVHVNHLNRCVRETTGKTTTDHIASRLSSEAKALLKYTDWNIAEIGYCLGFNEPAHFNYFFKKHTGLAPSAFRHV